MHSIRAIAGAVLAAAGLLCCGTPALGQCEVEKLGAAAGPGDDFGRAVAVWGDVAVVGDPLGSGGVGAAFIYRRDGFDWMQEAVLTTPEPHAEPTFGQAVAIRGDLLFVGDPNANAPEVMSGAVHVYRYCRSSGEWQHEARLTGSDGDEGDNFGHSIGLGDDLALIGAYDDENAGTPRTGSAYVFHLEGGQWNEETKLVAPNGQTYDGFGWAAALDCGIAIIGAHGTDHSGFSSGSAYVFRDDGAGWVFEQELRAPDPAPGDWFGFSVSLVGHTALIGSPQDEDQRGSAHVFQCDGAEWVHKAKLTAAEPVGPDPFFGMSVALSGDETRIVVGAPTDSAMGAAAGATHLFHHDGQGWVETAKLVASDGGPGAFFGRLVAVSGDNALMGAPRWTEAPGRMYVFAGIAGADCNGNLNPDACDIFEGTSLDLNGNGIPDECENLGDLNGDGVVNVLDLLGLLANWGPCALPCPPSCNGDLNGDCNVDHGDLILLLSSWS